MSTVAWIGDEFGIQKRAVPMEGLTYVIPEDNFERCFSKHGFAYPLTAHEIDYAALIEGRLPTMPDRHVDASCVSKWMLIDHHGEVWQTDYFVEPTESANIRKFCYWSVPAGKVSTLAISDDRPDVLLLAGFLKACQDKQRVSDFVVAKKIGGGRPMHWLSKAAVVERLNKEFPQDLVQ